MGYFGKRNKNVFPISDGQLRIVDQHGNRAYRVVYLDKKNHETFIKYQNKKISVGNMLHPVFSENELTVLDKNIKFPKMTPKRYKSYRGGSY